MARFQNRDIQRSKGVGSLLFYFLKRQNSCTRLTRILLARVVGVAVLQFVHLFVMSVLSPQKAHDCALGQSTIKWFSDLQYTQILHLTQVAVEYPISPQRVQHLSSWNALARLQRGLAAKC